MPGIATRKAETTPTATLERIMRLGDLVGATRLSRRTIERMISAGTFPRPDRRVGRIPLWRESTIARWLDDQPS